MSESLCTKRITHHISRFDVVFRFESENHYCFVWKEMGRDGEILHVIITTEIFLVFSFTLAVTTLVVSFAFRTVCRIAVLPTPPVSCTAHDNFCIGSQPTTTALPFCRPVTDTQTTSVIIILNVIVRTRQRDAHDRIEKWTLLSFTASRSIINCCSRVFVFLQYCYTRGNRLFLTWRPTPIP